jgi:hypothetical protein
MCGCNGNNNEQELTRRKLLYLTGAAGLSLALSGCGGGGGSSTSSGTLTVFPQLQGILASYATSDGQLTYFGSRSSDGLASSIAHALYQPSGMSNSQIQIDYDTSTGLPIGIKSPTIQLAINYASATNTSITIWNSSALSQTVSFNPSNGTVNPALTVAELPHTSTDLTRTSDTPFLGSINVTYGDGTPYSSLQNISMTLAGKPISVNYTGYYTPGSFQYWVPSSWTGGSPSQAAKNAQLANLFDTLCNANDIARKIPWQLLVESLPVDWEVAPFLAFVKLLSTLFGRVCDIAGKLHTSELITALAEQNQAYTDGGLLTLTINDPSLASPIVQTSQYAGNNTQAPTFTVILPKNSLNGTWSGPISIPVVGSCGSYNLSATIIFQDTNGGAGGPISGSISYTNDFNSGPEGSTFTGTRTGNQFSATFTGNSAPITGALMSNGSLVVQKFAYCTDSATGDIETQYYQFIASNTASPNFRAAQTAAVVPPVCKLGYYAHP